MVRTFGVPSVPSSVRFREVLNRNGPEFSGMLIGAHVSIVGGIERSIGRGEDIGCDAIQIFSKNQRQWRSRPFREGEAEAFRENWENSGIQKVAIHDSYLINLCNPDDEGLEKSRDAFVEEMERAQMLGVPYLIFHPGSHKEEGEEWGVREIAESLDACVEETDAADVRLLLESTAGQGTSVGYRFEQLRDVIEASENPGRIGVCLDTAHAFEAGYDVRGDGVLDVLDELDDVVGLDRVEAFHANDSKTGLGSRVDRHEHIGEGRIGKETFANLLRDDRLEEVPLLLETPGDREDFARNVEVLRGLEPHRLSGAGA